MRRMFRGGEQVTKNRGEPIVINPNTTPAGFCLETERLTLRPLREQDADSIYQNVKVYDISKWTINIPHPYPKDGASSFVKNAIGDMQKGDAYHFAIVSKNTNDLVGVMSFIDINEAHRNAEIGYWVGKKDWNRGIATEAALRIFEFGFCDLNLERISARCFSNNDASCRVMEKAGMECEGRFRHEVYKDDKFIDLVYYAIIKEDWKKRK